MSRRSREDASILILTTGHDAIDDRIYYKEILSALRDFPNITIAAPTTNGRPKELDSRVGFIDLGRPREGLKRLALLPRAVAAVVRAAPTICHFHDFELLLAVPFLRSLTRAKLVFDCHEVYPETALGSNHFPEIMRPLAALFVDVFERAVVAGLDGVIASDAEVARRFEGIAEKVQEVCNFPQLSYFSADDPAPEKVKAMQDELRGRRVAIYQGGMGEDRGLYVMAEAMSVLKTEARDIVLILLGSFSERDEERLSRYLRAQQLEDTVRRPGEVPHLEVPAWIRLAQVGLVPLQPTAKFMKNTPIKVFEYMACGVPVLGADLPPIRSFTERAESGRVFDSTSATCLAREMISLLEDHEARKRMGANGRRWIEEQWNWDAIAQRVPDLYDTLLGS